MTAVHSLQLADTVTLREFTRVARMLKAPASEWVPAGKTLPGAGGPLQIVGTHDAQTGVRLLGVEKGHQAIAEVAGTTAARMLGIQHLAPIAMMSDATTVRMTHVPGTPAELLNITGVEELITIRAEGIRRMNPRISEALAHRRARAELGVAQTLDYLIANTDRHSGNVIIDETALRPMLIDFGAIGDVPIIAPESQLAPRLKPFMQAPDGATSLNGDTMEWLVHHVTDDRLRSWHELFGAHTPKTSLDTLLARWQHIQENSGFNYERRGFLNVNRAATHDMYAKKAALF